MAALTNPETKLGEVIGLLPIQKRHFKDVSAASLLLAAKEDANA